MTLAEHKAKVQNTLSEFIKEARTLGLKNSLGFWVGDKSTENKQLLADEKKLQEQAKNEKTDGKEFLEIAQDAFTLVKKGLVQSKLAKEEGESLIINKDLPGIQKKFKEASTAFNEMFESLGLEE